MVVLIVMAGICIPIVAIVTSHQYRMRKLQMEEGDVAGGRIHQLEQYVKVLAEENEELKNRLGNVETIISDPDFLLGMPQKEDTKEAQKRLETLASQIKKGV